MHLLHTVPLSFFWSLSGEKMFNYQDISFGDHFVHSHDLWLIMQWHYNRKMHVDHYWGCVSCIAQPELQLSVWNRTPSQFPLVPVWKWGNVGHAIRSSFYVSVNLIHCTKCTLVTNELFCKVVKHIVVQGHVVDCSDFGVLITSAKVKKWLWRRILWWWLSLRLSNIHRSFLGRQSPRLTYFT